LFEADLVVAILRGAVLVRLDARLGVRLLNSPTCFDAITGHIGQNVFAKCLSRCLSSPHRTPAIKPQPVPVLHAQPFRQAAPGNPRPGEKQDGIRERAVVRGDSTGITGLASQQSLDPFLL
jgi:hypothetical protein